MAGSIIWLISEIIFSSIFIEIKFNQAFLVFYIGIILAEAFLFTILYFTISEIKLSQTVGKKFYSIGIADEGVTGGITVIQSVVRNLLKILPWLVIIDFVIGYFIRPKSNQRALGILSKTKVVEMEGFTFPRYHNPTEQENVAKAFRIILTSLGGFFVIIILISPILMIGSM